MCGIFLTVAPTVDDEFMSDMFVMDTLRGKDSCGLITVTNNETEVFKRAVPALDFIDMKKYDKLYWKNTNAAVGHNRAATKGSVNAANAHPFTCGSITGVHNGTLRGQWRLPDSTNYEVDSENIFHAIDKLGIEAAWRLIDGAAALIWWDSKDKTLNVIRNSERPLYLTKSPTGSFYAASEKFMLLAAMERNQLKWTDVNEIPVNTLYTFDVKARTYKTKKLNGLVQPYYKDYDYHQGGYSKYPARTSKSTVKGKKVVNFEVSYIEAENTGTYYYVLDTADKSRATTCYTIEDFRNQLDMEVGDTGTSSVLYTTKGETFLSTYDLVVNDKGDEGILEGEVCDNDIPFDKDSEVCSVCTSEIKIGESMVIDVKGNTYCNVCANESFVGSYIRNKSTEVTVK